MDCNHVLDKLKSYEAAKKEIMPGVEHRQHKGLNNRAENSHQPTRRRERQMKRFKSARHAQRFLSAHDQINNLFLLPRHLMPATDYRADRARAFQVHIFIDFGQLCSSKPTAHVHGNRTAVFMISATCFQAGQHT